MNHRELERALKAVANRRRLAILSFLKKREAPVGDIADEIKLSFRATSRHLTVLANVDIVERDQRGTQVFYSLSRSLPDIIRRLVASL